MKTTTATAKATVTTTAKEAKHAKQIEEARRQIDRAKADITAQQKQKKHSGQQKPFAVLMKEYEADTVHHMPTADTVQPLSRATAHSTIKTVLDPEAKTATTRDKVSNSGPNKKIAQMYAKLCHQEQLLNVAKIVADTDIITYNSNGDRVVNTADTPQQSATIDDCYDIVQNASVELLERARAMRRARTLYTGRGQRSAYWTQRKAEAEEAQREDSAKTLESWYNKRVLDKHVVIRTEDSAKWKDKETNHIRETMHSCRQLIADNRALNTEPTKYTYFSEMVKDTESAEECAIYHRFKGYDIGGAVCNINGMTDLYTADSATAEEEEELIEAMHLTARQALVLHYRRQGHGKKAIASALGVNPDTVRDILRGIQKKARDIGLDVDSMTAREEAREERQKREALKEFAEAKKRAEAQSAKRKAEAERCAREARRALIAKAEAKRKAEEAEEAQRTATAPTQTAEEAQQKREAQRRATAEAEAEAKKREAQREARRALIAKAEAKKREAPKKTEAQRTAEAERSAEIEKMRARAERKKERAEARKEIERARAEYARKYGAEILAKYDRKYRHR